MPFGHHMGVVIHINKHYLSDDRFFSCDMITALAMTEKEHCGRSERDLLYGERKGTCTVFVRPPELTAPQR
jgi:hypothetical protein